MGNTPEAVAEYSLRLSGENASLIKSIQAAYQLYQIPPDGNTQHTVSLTRRGTIHAEAFVESAKRYPGFRDRLSYDDQITLLKGGAIEAFILRYAHYYQENAKFYSAKLHRLDVPTDRIQALLEFFKKTALKKLDEIQFALLQSLVVFNPARDNLQNKDLVTSIRSQAITALEQYCLVSQNLEKRKINLKQPCLLFCSLMELLTDLQLLKETYSNMLKQNRHGDGNLTPLLYEIWDLNPVQQNTMDSLYGDVFVNLNTYPTPVATPQPIRPPPPPPPLVSGSLPKVSGSLSGSPSMQQQPQQQQQQPPNFNWNSTPNFLTEIQQAQIRNLTH